jgi:galactokinase
MNGPRIAEALVALGLDDSERAAIAGVFDRVLFATSGADGWDYASWTPGRLEVFGTHTDYAGGRTLVCAVPRGIAMAARRRSDGRIIVTDAARGESIEIEISRPAPLERWGRYVAVTVARLARNFAGAVGGMEIVFESTLPRASGMSSSSALVVAIASAIVDLNDLTGREEWVSNLRSPLDPAGYFACIENGSPFGALAGDAGVGTHGGSEDHAAILTARPSTVTAFRFVPMIRLADVVMPSSWRFVIAASEIRAEKTGAAQGRYNQLADEVRVLLDIWNAHEPPVPSLGAALQTSPAAVHRLRDLVKASPLPAALVESLSRRLAHFAREDAIVSAAVDAFRAGDVETLGDLASSSQAAAESLLRNQVPQTVELARSARRLGAFAARSFGAGFGGSVWALVDAARAAEFARDWHPQAFVMRPGPPHARV